MCLLGLNNGVKFLSELPILRPGGLGFLFCKIYHQCIDSEADFQQAAMKSFRCPCDPCYRPQHVQAIRILAFFPTPQGTRPLSFAVFVELEARGIDEEFGVMEARE